MVVTRAIPSNASSVTIIKDAANRYFASFVLEVVPEVLPSNSEAVGIDLGLTHFTILSNGEKIENPRHHKKQLKCIKKANRKLSNLKLLPGTSINSFLASGV